MGKLKREYFEYLLETKLLEKASPKKLFTEGKWISSIEKIGSGEDCIYPSPSGMVAWLDSPENRQIVKGALQQAINEKKFRLEKSYISDEKITVLL